MKELFAALLNINSDTRLMVTAGSIVALILSRFGLFDALHGVVPVLWIVFSYGVCGVAFDVLGAWLRHRA